MLDEITKDIKATLYDRIASPFTGSLVISWIYWNWEILVVLFFMDHESLELAKNDYIKSTLITKWNILWAPLISASILTIFYPIISTGAYYIWQFFQRKKRAIKINSEDKVPLDIKESIELRLQMRKMQETFHESNQSSASQIGQLQNENNALKSKVRKLEEQLDGFEGLQDSFKELSSKHELEKEKRIISQRSLQTVLGTQNQYDMLNHIFLKKRVETRLLDDGILENLMRADLAYIKETDTGRFAKLTNLGESLVKSYSTLKQ